MDLSKTIEEFREEFAPIASLDPEDLSPLEAGLFRALHALRRGAVGLSVDLGDSRQAAGAFYGANVALAILTALGDSPPETRAWIATAVGDADPLEQARALSALTLTGTMPPVPGEEE